MRHAIISAAYQENVHSKDADASGLFVASLVSTLFFVEELCYVGGAFYESQYFASNSEREHKKSIVEAAKIEIAT
jgi:hypothetical protein